LKTLIINGSPRLNGDTAALIRQLKRHLHGEIIEISAYRDKIAPCVDCRACRSVRGCVVDDDMRVIYADDYDNVVAAFPVYYSNLPGPLISLLSRFQPQHNALHYLGDPIEMRLKKGAILAVAGGKGNVDGSMRLARILMKCLNAADFEEHTVVSQNTDTIPAADDAAAMKGVRDIAKWLNG